MDKACFQHDMAYEDFTDWNRRTTSDKVLHDTAYGISNSWRHSSFTDNIWGADLADMELISKFNKGFRFLLCVIDIYSRYAWVVPLKDKKGITITSVLKKFRMNETTNQIKYG